MEQQSRQEQSRLAHLTDAVSGQTAATLAEPQLSEKLRQFKREVSAIARQYLPATATALPRNR